LSDSRLAYCPKPGNAGRHYIKNVEISIKKIQDGKKTTQKRSVLLLKLQEFAIGSYKQKNSISIPQNENTMITKKYFCGLS